MPVPSAWPCGLYWVCLISLFVCPCPTAIINCPCLRCEIRCVCKLTEGVCYWNANYIRQSSLYYSLSPLFMTGQPNTQLSQSRSLIFQYVYQNIQMKKKQKMDFPALQYVHLCVQILVQLPIQSAFAYVNVCHVEVKIVSKCYSFMERFRILCWFHRNFWYRSAVLEVSSKITWSWMQNMNTGALFKFSMSCCLQGHYIKCAVLDCVPCVHFSRKLSVCLYHMVLRMGKRLIIWHNYE